MPFVGVNESSEPKNRLDPLYHETKRAIELTKEFIRDRGLICYGGTALDYAARLKGSKIYDDSKLDLPDLDFYSSDPVKDSRDLSDILFKNGFADARSIRASHVGTFRVDSGNNHFVADVSYCPIFPEIKTLCYEGLKIVDPIYQRVDIHSSLSFPYDNPPLEVIFNRWKKDIERFNIINELYPITPDYIEKMGGADSLNDISNMMSFIGNSFVYTGVIGHNLLTGVASFPEVIEVCSKEIDEISDSLEVIDTYEPYFNLLPEMVFAKDSSGRKYIVYSTEHRLLSREIIKVADKKIRVSCMNFILKIFLGWTLIKDTHRYPWIPDHGGKMSIIGDLYNSTLKNIKLSIEAYGYENIDHSTLMKLEEQDIRLSGDTRPTMFPMPVSYKSSNASKDASSRPGEPFDYRSNPLLKMSGSKIIINSNND